MESETNKISFIIRKLKVSKKRPTVSKESYYMEADLLEKFYDLI